MNGLLKHFKTWSNYWFQVNLLKLNMNHFIQMEIVCGHFVRNFCNQNLLSFNFFSLHNWKKILRKYPLMRSFIFCKEVWRCCKRNEKKCLKYINLKYNRKYSSYRQTGWFGIVFNLGPEFCIRRVQADRLVEQCV
jgi:hypothetical protein